MFAQFQLYCNTIRWSRFRYGFMYGVLIIALCTTVMCVIAKKIE